MHFSKLIALSALVTLASHQSLRAQTDSPFRTLPLENFNAFVTPPANWVVAADAVGNPFTAHDLRPIKGQGAVVCTSPSAGLLQTKDSMGSVEVELDFMNAKGSPAAIMLMGRYMLQLADSWTLPHISGNVAGAIGASSSAGGRAMTVAPLDNVSHAPGLWQHVSFRFRAPGFDTERKSWQAARFDEVYLNGVLVQARVNIPDMGSNGDRASSKGPLAFAGGPVAFRNIRYRELGAESDSAGPATDFRNISNPILLTADARPYLLRSFVMYGNRKLTHVISYGDPSGLNFSYDLKQGSIFQVWRGRFMNVTEMWEDRGEPQLAVPLGSVIVMPVSPVVAAPGSSDAWPDSVSFDEQVTHGYVLDHNRMPTFTYSMKGMEVTDSLSKLAGDQGLSRTISIQNPLPNAMVRLAASLQIEDLGDGLYGINGKSYYIRVDKRFQPSVRASAKQKELVVKYNPSSPLSYSIIW